MSTNIVARGAWVGITCAVWSLQSLKHSPHSPCHQRPQLCGEWGQWVDCGATHCKSALSFSKTPATSACAAAPPSTTGAVM